MAGIPNIPVTSGLPGLDATTPSFLKLLQGSLGGVSDLGSILGAQAGGEEQTQLAQGQLGQGYNNNLLNLYGQQQNAQNQAAQLDLERQNYATQNRGTTAKQALLGALLGGGYQPTQISTPGIPQSTVSGGLARSLLSNPQTIAAMQTLNKQATTAQNTPLSFTGGQLLPAPTLTAPPKLSTGTAGKTGGFLQDLAGIGKIALPFLSLL